MATEWTSLQARGIPISGDEEGVGRKRGEGFPGDGLTYCYNNNHDMHRLVLQQKGTDCPDRGIDTGILLKKRLINRRRYLQLR